MLMVTLESETPRAVMSSGFQASMMEPDRRPETDQQDHGGPEE